MSRFWSDRVADLTPYTPGEQPKVADLLKLNTNEHPFGPSPLAVQAIKEAADDRLRLYPDYDSSVLRQAIATLYGLQANQVFLGNGSDEILAHIFNGLFRHSGKRLMMPDISYSFYRTYCRMYQVTPEIIALADDFSIRAADYTASGRPPCGGVIFANPNAPTGIALSLTEIEQIVGGNPDCAVVVDEAYVDFGAQSAVGLLARHDNLVVVQTLSKSRSLAGLRVGFAMASPNIIDGLIRIKDSFNSYPVDRLAQAGALASLLDTAYFEQTRLEVMQTRDELLTPRLTDLGFQVLPSRANFVFARHPNRSGLDLSKALRERHILVRYFAQARIDQFLRITVGTPGDCERLCNALAEILGRRD